MLISRRKSSNLRRWKTNKPKNQPPRYKLFLLTWLAIYPLITAILFLFGKYLSLLPLLLRTLLLTGVLVYLMTYWIMPNLTKIFQTWLKT